MNQDKIGRFIAKIRRELDLTQAQLGQKVGVDHRVISKWETGRYMPDLGYLKSLSEALGVSIDEILVGERIPVEPKENNNNSATNNNNNTLQTKNEASLKAINNYVNSAKKVIIKKSFIIIVVLFLFFLGIISLLLITNNYDNCYVYKITAQSENYNVEGVFTSTPENNILSINLIENVTDFTIDEEMAYDYEYTLYLEDEIITQIGDIGNYKDNMDNQLLSLNEVLQSIHIYVSEDHSYNKFFHMDNYDGLVLKIMYINQDKEQKELDIPLHLSKLFSNDKILYNGGFNFKNG